MQERFNSELGAGVDNISRVKDQLDTVKDVMVQNIGALAKPHGRFPVILILYHPTIDRVLERGEKIELLVDKTDRLSQQAYKFERSVCAIYKIEHFYRRNHCYVSIPSLDR